MERDAETAGGPGTWETARELGKQLKFPVGPYEPRVPTADEMNAILPYLMDRISRFITDKYFCENAELTFAHALGINVPAYGFPDSSGYNHNSRHTRGYGRDWEGYDEAGYNQQGFNREGLDRYGCDKEGYDKDGYDRSGYDRLGFNRDGRDYNGRTREEGIKQLVDGWSDEFAEAVFAEVAKLNLPEPEPPKPAKKAAKKAAARAADRPHATRKAPVKKATKKAVPVAA